MKQSRLFVQSASNKEKKCFIIAEHLDDEVKNFTGKAPTKVPDEFKLYFHLPRNGVEQKRLQTLGRKLAADDEA
jgi:hypothetical protein